MGKYDTYVIEFDSVITEFRNSRISRDLDMFIVKAKIEIEPIDSNQVHIARRPYQEIGKMQNPSSLNFGNCFAYALSILVSHLLLFKGKISRIQM